MCYTFLLLHFQPFWQFKYGKEVNINGKISKYIEVKNEKYYKDFVKHYNKSKKIKLNQKLNLNYRLNLLIIKSGLKRSALINPITIIIMCILSFGITYYTVFNIFRIAALSAIIALPALLIPIFLLEFLKDRNQNKVEKIILDFVLQLKNYTKINNDIVYAFKQLKTIEPLQGYINTFLIEINSGIKFENAIDNIKEKFELSTMKTIFSNIQYCYLYGGDYSKLMDKSYKMINKIQKEKASRTQETKNARIVLVILIILDLFIYFSFIKNNYNNYIIMTRRVFGNIILYWNFISIWVLIFLMNRVKKLDY